MVMVFCQEKLLALKAKDGEHISYTVPSGRASSGDDLLKKAESIVFSAIRRKVKDIVFVKDVTVGKDITIIYRAEIARPTVNIGDRFLGSAWLTLEAAVREENFGFLIRGVCTYLYGLNSIALKSKDIVADAVHNKCKALSGEQSGVTLADGNTIYKIKRRNYCYVSDKLAAFKLVGKVADIFCKRFSFINKGGYAGKDWHSIELEPDTDISVLLDMITVSYEQMRI